MKSNNFFWYFLLPVAVGITLTISLSPWFFEYLATPAGQVFSGINRWSSDYFTYLSYVELGRRGELGARLLATTQPQIPVYAHLAHTLPGFVFGHLFGFNSIFSYHLARAIYGLIFLILCWVFFYRLTKSKMLTAVAFWLTFYVAGFPKIDHLWPISFSRYLAWFQEQNIIGRATGPLHYTAGAIFFILVVLWWFTGKTAGWKKILVAGILINFTLLANPFAFLILSVSFGIFALVTFAWDSLVPFTLAIPLFLYNQHFLSQPPWGTLGNAPAFYIISHPAIPFWDAIMSIGPIFFLGIAGAILMLLRESEDMKFLRQSHVELPQLIFLIIWFFVQLFLFFFGDFVRLDPLRSFNSLYYLPLALFSAYLITIVSTQLTQIIIQIILRKRKHLFRAIKEQTEQQRGEWVFLIARNTVLSFLLFTLFIITGPNYYLSYKEQLFAFTDFKSFSNFTYPTVAQVAAFRWLEKNTPVGSGVLALYEASFLIIGFSGNATGANMDYNLRTPFYSGTLSARDADQFLKNNHFRYVYDGYQERAVGGNIALYPFLKKIYENPEVKIYQVR